MSRSKKILFQMTGSVACYKACEVLSQLRQHGHEIKVIATAAALQFIGKATLEGLCSSPPLSDLFAAGSMMDHIALGRWCDIALLCPATANSINRLAAGLADDLVGATFLAFDRTKPYLIVPAMNARMLNAGATQSSLEKLRAWGITVLDTECGYLACGDEGEGRLLDSERILQAVEVALSRTESPQRLKVLVTAGGTREAIDAVRYIGSVSTGQTGAMIARSFAERGHAVTSLHARDTTVVDHPHVALHSFETFSELDELLQSLLQRDSYDAVIHVAAVSDFSPKEVCAGKLDSSEEVTLQLKRNFKIVERIRSYSRNSKINIVAFKLTANADDEKVCSAVKQLDAAADVDYIVHNDVAEISSAQHRFRIFQRTSLIRQCETKKALAETLEKILVEHKGTDHLWPVPEHSTSELL